MTDDSPTHRKLVAAALATLRKKGYFAYMNFACCSTCGWGAIPDERLDRVTFFHVQENDRAFEGGKTLKQPLCLQWNGDAAEICRAFIKQGLLVGWDGKGTSCIQILPPGVLPDSTIAVSQ